MYVCIIFCICYIYIYNIIRIMYNKISTIRYCMYVHIRQCYPESMSLILIFLYTFTWELNSLDKYVRMYVQYIHMDHVCTYVCTHVCAYVCTYVRKYICMHAVRAASTAILADNIQYMHHTSLYICTVTVQELIKLT